MVAELDAPLHPPAWSEASKEIENQAPAPVATIVESLKEDTETRAETLRSVRSVVQQLSRQVQDFARIPVDETSFEMLRSSQSEMLGVFDSTLQKLVPEVTDSIDEMNQYFFGSLETEVADALRQCLVTQEERSSALRLQLEGLSADMHVTCAEEARSELDEPIDDPDDPDGVAALERQARAARRRSLEDLIQKEKNRTHQLVGFVMRQMKNLLKDQFDQIRANIDEIRVDGELHRNELIRSISTRNSEEEKRLRWELEEERQRTLLALGQSSGNLELVKEVEGIRDTIVSVTEMVANSDKGNFEEMQPSILGKLKSVMKQVSSNLDHMRRASIASPGSDTKEVLDMQGPAAESDQGSRVASTRSADAAACPEVISAPAAARRSGSPPRRTGNHRANSGTDSLAASSDGTWAESLTAQDTPVRPRRSGSASSTGHGRAPAPLPGSKRMTSSSPRASGGAGSRASKGDKRERTPGPSKALRERAELRREGEYGGSAKIPLGGSTRGSGSSRLSSGSAAASPGRTGSAHGSAHGSARNPREVSESRKGRASRDSSPVRSPVAPKRDVRSGSSPKRDSQGTRDDFTRGSRSSGREGSPKRRSDELRHTPPQTTYQAPPLNPQAQSKAAGLPDCQPPEASVSEISSQGQQSDTPTQLAPVGGVTVIPPSNVVGAGSLTASLSAARLVPREPRVMTPSAMPMMPGGPTDGRQESRLVVRPAVAPAAVTPLPTVPDSLRSPGASWRHASPPVANGAPPTMAAPTSGPGRSSPGRPAIGLSSPAPMRGPSRMSTEDANSDAASIDSTQQSIIRGGASGPSGLEAVTEISGSLSMSLPLGNSPAPAARPLSVEGRREVSRVASVPRMPSMPLVMMAQGNLPVMPLQPPGRSASLTMQEALRIKSIVQPGPVMAEIGPSREMGLQPGTVSVERPLSNSQRP
mmetsp:Transcript_29438/g.54241  ORF Transcript_29438/g.54241 Transcript_29438/m.54241 type:complete len:932 (-) Transcript_29438:150-2945(-)